MINILFLKKLSFSLILFLFLLSSCNKKGNPEEILRHESFYLELVSIKNLTKDIYYNLNIKIKENNISYELDENRDIVIGSYVADMGFRDAKGSISVEKLKIEKLKEFILKAQNNTNNECLLLTIIKIKSKGGYSEVILKDDELYKEIVRFIQFDLLDNKIKL